MRNDFFRENKVTVILIGVIVFLLLLLGGVIVFLQLGSSDEKELADTVSTVGSPTIFKTEHEFEGTPVNEDAYREEIATEYSKYKEMKEEQESGKNTSGTGNSNDGTSKNYDHSHWNTTNGNSSNGGGSNGGGSNSGGSNGGGSNGGGSNGGGSNSGGSNGGGSNGGGSNGGGSNGGGSNGGGSNGGGSNGGGSNGGGSNSGGSNGGGSNGGGSNGGGSNGGGNVSVPPINVGGEDKDPTVPTLPENPNPPEGNGGDGDGNGSGNGNGETQPPDPSDVDNNNKLDDNLGDLSLSISYPKISEDDVGALRPEEGSVIESVNSLLGAKTAAGNIGIKMIEKNGSNGTVVVFEAFNHTKEPMVFNKESFSVSLLSGPINPDNMSLQNNTVSIAPGQREVLRLSLDVALSQILIVRLDFKEYVLRFNIYGENISQVYDATPLFSKEEAAEMDLGLTSDDQRGLIYVVNAPLVAAGNHLFKFEPIGVARVLDDKIGDLSPEDAKLGALGVMKVKVANTGNKPMHLKGVKMASVPAGDRLDFKTAKTLSEKTLKAVGEHALPSVIQPNELISAYIPFSSEKSNRNTILFAEYQYGDNPDDIYVMFFNGVQGYPLLKK